MRPIHIAGLEKQRPALVLTRAIVRPHLDWVTVAPITSTIRGLATEVLLGKRNGLDMDSVVTVDNIITIRTSHLGRHLGFLLPEQEAELSRAFVAAFDLAALG